MAPVTSNLRLNTGYAAGLPDHADSKITVVPEIDEISRHPSQLYEAILEGVILFIILISIIYKKETKTGIVSALFMILYGFFRIIAEQFREPDPQIGYLFELFTMGSVLSFSMILIGLFILKKATNNDFSK